MTAEQVWEKLEAYWDYFKPFWDATQGICTYKCTVLDCPQGLQIAMHLKWYDYKTFNVKEYEFYEKVDNGDMNWVVPGKFMAFSSPFDTNVDDEGYK